MLPRRTHTKSRNGCTNCKRRKVKCDEGRPICFNCKRNGVPCSLSSGTPKPSSAARSIAPAIPLAKNPPTPASSGALTTTSSPSIPASLAIPPGFDHILPCQPHELWGRDLELLHHWCTGTVQTISIREDIQHTWRTVVPREGYQHSFVMHGILSVAATHKAYLIPSQQNLYLSLADYHQMIGSESFRSNLENINDDNWTAAFGYASLLVLHMLCRPARSDGAVEESITNVLELVGVLRGIRASVSPVTPRAYRSSLAPLVYGVWPTEEEMSVDSIPALVFCPLPVDTFEALGELRAFQKLDLPSASDKYYAETVSSLEHSARAIACMGMHAEAGVILSWPYRLHDSVLTDLRTRKPHALLLLAYTAVFFGAMEKTFWLVRGWAKGLFLEVERLLAGDAKFLRLLKWPKKQLTELYALL